MLDKPDLPEATISSYLLAEYGIKTSQVTFLPLGYDFNTAVYRVESRSGTPYFLKLRNGKFEPITVSLPEYLCHVGIHAIIVPLETAKHQLFGKLGKYTSILYPFIPGKNGYELELTDQHWVEIGHTLKMVHEVSVPEELCRSIPREVYNSRGRRRVKRFLFMVDRQTFKDSIANNLAACMRDRRKQIARMVMRADALAVLLRNQPIEFVLCHSDAHPGNYLVAETGELYLVDWDNPVFAPRERDLMCFGSGMTGSPLGGREERLFYQGYGSVEVNRQALAYYRYERIIQDIAEFCSQILLSPAGREDRQQSLDYFLSSFAPGHEVEVAFTTDPVKSNWA